LLKPKHSLFPKSDAATVLDGLVEVLLGVSSDLLVLTQASGALISYFCVYKNRLLHPS
jgi:hypothetical protein